MSQTEPEQSRTTPPRREDVAAEVRELGERVQEAIRAAVESPRTKEVQQQVSEGFAELARQVEAALRAAQESRETRRLGEQAKQVVESARSGEIVDEVRSGLVRGLRVLNEQLERLVERLEAEKREGDQPNAESSGVPPSPPPAGA